MTESQDDKRSTLRTPGNALWIGILSTALGVVVLGIFNIGTRRLLATNLTLAEYGFFYSAFSLVSTILTILSLGLTRSTTVLIAQNMALGNVRKARATYGLVLIIRLLGGLLAMVVVAACNGWLLTHYFHFPQGRTTLYLMAVYVPLAALTGSVVNAYDALSLFIQRNLLMALQFGLIFFTVLIGPSEDLATPAIGLLIGVSVMSIIGLVVLNWRYDFAAAIPASGEVRMIAGEFWAIGRWMAISAAAMSLMNALDTAMLTILTDLTEVGLYNIALPVVHILTMVLALSTAFAPTIVRLWNQDRHEESESLLNHCLVVGLWLGFGVILGTVISGEGVITLLFGAEFREAYPALRILSVQVPFLLATNLFLITLAAMGRLAWLGKCLVLGLILNGVLNLLLIPHFGVNGAATATTAGQIAACLLGSLGFRGKIQVFSRMGTWLVLAVTAVVVGAAMLWLTRAVHGPFALIGCGAGAVLVYSAVCVKLLRPSITAVIRHR